MSYLVKNSDYNAKMSEMEDKVPTISGPATTSALTAVEYNIPSLSNLVNRTNYDKKISDLKKKILIITMANVLLFQNLIN